MQTFNPVIWQRPLLGEGSKSWIRTYATLQAGQSDSWDGWRKGTPCSSQDLLCPGVSAAISAMIWRGAMHGCPAFPRFWFVEKLTLFRLQGTIEMKQQPQNYLAAHCCINATGSLLEWEQNASEQLTSGGYFCQ